MNISESNALRARRLPVFGLSVFLCLGFVSTELFGVEWSVGTSHGHSAVKQTYDISHENFCLEMTRLCQSDELKCNRVRSRSRCAPGFSKDRVTAYEMNGVSGELRYRILLQETQSKDGLASVTFPYMVGSWKTGQGAESRTYLLSGCIGRLRSKSASTNSGTVLHEEFEDLGRIAVMTLQCSNSRSTYGSFMVLCSDTHELLGKRVLSKAEFIENYGGSGTDDCWLSVSEKQSTLDEIEVAMNQIISEAVAEAQGQIVVTDDGPSFIAHNEVRLQNSVKFFR